MILTVATRWLLPAAICGAMVSTSAMAGKAPEPVHLRGTGFLLVDPRDSQEQIKDRMREFFSFEGQDVVLSDQRQSEIARKVDALFVPDGATLQEFPEVSFEFPPSSTIELFRVALQNSELARRSEEVCPSDCTFHDLDEGSFHIHLTKPTGGPGDTVLVVRFRESSGTREGSLVTGGLSVRPEWLKRRTPVDGARPEGIRVFGLLLTLRGSENRTSPQAAFN